MSRSCQDWRTTFADFATNFLKTDINCDDYHRAMVACEATLLGKEADGLMLSILSFEPLYGAAIVTTEDILNPLQVKLWVIGLDGWTFTIDAHGSHNADCDSDPAFLLVREIPSAKIDVFINALHARLRLAETKRGNDRHSYNEDGGMQRTPGFLYSKCIEVLCDSKNNIFENSEVPNIILQCSGFTDVGMHTGCNPRETSLPLVQAVIRTTLNFGMSPELKDASHFYSRFMAEFFLDLALNAAKENTANNYSKDKTNEAMRYLTTVSYHLHLDQYYWPDSIIGEIAKKCEQVRKDLDTVSAKTAYLDSQKYVVIIPDLTMMGEAVSPPFVAQSEPEKKNVELDLLQILASSKINLAWLPVENIKTLTDCKALLEDARFNGKKAYQFSIVFTSIETFLFCLGQDFLLKDANRTPASFDTDLLIDVFDRYDNKLRDFIGNGETGGLMLTELYSHRVLMHWLKFCLLFKIGSDSITILTSFSVPLDYHDLEHLVLKDKWAWNMLDVICEFLKIRQNKGFEVIFSGRKDEMVGMFSLADRYAAEHSRTEFDILWAEEQKEANTRIESRWKVILEKRGKCIEIRESISRLNDDLNSTRRLLCNENQYIVEYFYRVGKRVSKRVTNEEWLRLNNQCKNIESAIRGLQFQLTNAQKAPEYLKQPLPKLELPDGKRALFFIHMPKLLRDIWQASFEAQQIIFSKGEALAATNKMCNFHMFYEQSYPYREQKKCTHTPLTLWIGIPPKQYGNKNVENIHDKEDGVWYQSSFTPTMLWTTGKNPFNAPRITAVELFTEQIKDAGLSWAVVQQGPETPAERGNIPFSKLHEKPMTMTRDQFLSLGNLRAQPLLQIYHLLDAIKARTLPFHEDTIQTLHTIVHHVLYHIGEIKQQIGSSERFVKFWKWGLEPYDPACMDAYREVLVAAVDNLKEAPTNHRELLIYSEIISFFSQFDSEGSSAWLELLDKCSNISFNWAERMDDEIQKARNECDSIIILEIQEKQYVFFLYALMAYEMLTFFDQNRMKRIIELVFRVHSSRPLTIKGNIAGHLICRAIFFMARILPLCSKITSKKNLLWNKILTHAVEKVLPNSVDLNMKWDPIENSYCWFAKNQAGNYLSINIMNGYFLLNGSPPKTLPLQIRRHPLFRRTFGDTDFEVTEDRSGLRKSIKPVIDRYYSFSYIEKELLIYEEYKNERFRLLDNRGSNKWGCSLPVGMIDLYSHWQSEDSHTIVFRPIPFRDRSIFYLLRSDGLYKIPREDFSKSVEYLLEKFLSYDRYLILDESMKNILSVFSKFDRIEYIHSYVTHEKNFKVVLIRYRITFELKKQSSVYDCLEYVGYKLKSVQQFSDALYDFNEYLILEKDNVEKVIFPRGEVEKMNGRVSIKRSANVIDDISQTAHYVNVFTIHPRFKFLQAVDVLSGLQLGAIQAATSSCLPESGPQLTGYEMAIQQIRRCWVNRPLSKDEERMIRSLLVIRDLPPALIILAHQLLKSSRQLAFLFPSSLPCISVDENELITAVNMYSLPLPSLWVRNCRLTLRPNEMHSFFGIIKPFSHVHPVNCQEAFKSFGDEGQKAFIYEKKEGEIKNIEKDLLELTMKSTLNDATKKQDDSISFPLTYVSSFKHRQIGEHMVNLLKESHIQHTRIPIARLSFEKSDVLRRCADIEKNVREQKESLFRILFVRIVDEKEIPTTKRAFSFLIYKASNGIAQLTKADLVQSSLKPEILKQFNPMLTNDDIKQLFHIIVDWMQFSVLEDKISRIIRHLESDMVDFAIQELQVQRHYDPYKHPQWLAFEYEQGLQIRPEQVLIINGILENNGCVAQLNMGLGKTRVIVPCLLLEWSRRETKQIPRVYFLSRLLNEGFDYLRQTLTGGVFEMKLFQFPFNRDIKISLEQAQLFVASLKYCQLMRGAIILAPEHRLSLQLKCFEIENNVESRLICDKIREADIFPFVDIFDEVDEMMCPNQELIYAEGSPVPLSSGTRRWGAVQVLLYNVRHHPGLQRFFEIKELADFASNKCPYDEFNQFRLLPGKRLDEIQCSLIHEIGKSLFEEKLCSSKCSSPENTLDWLYKIDSLTLKKRLLTFITDHTASFQLVKEFELIKPEYFQDLLVLRGLLAHKVFIHCLKLRHDVDYGVVANHKTAMAIPFKAANLPKLRSEFAQADCAVTFTTLSYYYIGLNKQQIARAFSTLLASGPSFQNRVYNEFYQHCIMSNKENLTTVDSISKLDLENQVQLDLLNRLYRKNMLVINFWLDYVLFPTATMIFPEKLLASSWNLTDSRMSSKRCGFSGTDDACIFLPHPLEHRESAAASIKATNGKMINLLLNNATYCRVPESRSDETFEDALARFTIESNVDAFIDVGALLSKLPVEEAAVVFLRAFVKSQSRFKGVVYYSSKKCNWRLIDTKYRETSLITSPIRECDAFVIFDQSRCRGADLKLKSDAKAFLSIGPFQCKDSLMQAAGRLRQLDFGQRILAITTQDVELLIKDCLGVTSKEEVAMEHVLCYALHNSVESIGNSLKHWSGQGLRFLNFFHDPSHVRGKEICDLETLYSVSEKFSTVSKTTLEQLDQIKVSHSSRCKTSTSIVRMIEERVLKLGEDVVASFIVNIDECERELEHERELGKEQEKEYAKMHAFREIDWDYQRIFTADSPKNIMGNEIVTDSPGTGTIISMAEFTRLFLSNQALSTHFINWDAGKIFLTPNFARPLEENPPYDDYLRPVRLILYFPQSKEILLVSEREADKLWRCLLEGNVITRQNGPIFCGINFLVPEKEPNSWNNSNRGRKQFLDLVSGPADLSPTSYSALSLFNGQTKFSQKDQQALKDHLLTSRQALDGAQFFCYHRGFRIMLEGSDLQKTCDQIYQSIHAKERESSEMIKSMYLFRDSVNGIMKTGKT
eukprot:CAMPEP_0172420326 /NCGR_PEP_ID=MMETSP1064-20121228/6710_1 /TAXON_ID=202472 /ORGANISM="Aulacoseira subarctica , Strain CCAP 1002/5" /LENGTH=2877 /DNA_ID=CAMNT_0013160247 /DNA_START=12 /DNA_END=8645 /DNA_ORIENTATION=-